MSHESEFVVLFNQNNCNLSRLSAFGQIHDSFTGLVNAALVLLNSSTAVELKREIGVLGVWEQVQIS